MSTSIVPAADEAPVPYPTLKFCKEEGFSLSGSSSPTLLASTRPSNDAESRSLFFSLYLLLGGPLFRQEQSCFVRSLRPFSLRCRKQFSLKLFAAELGLVTWRLRGQVSKIEL